MANSAKPSPSIVAAAMVAILCALLVLFVAFLGFYSGFLVSARTPAAQLPPFTRSLAIAFMAFLMCLSLFGIATGAGLLYLRDWARIAVLIWAGFSIFFGAIGIPIAFLVPLTPPPNAPSIPADSLQAVRWILLFGYSFPLLLGLWWLILFNLKSIKAQFTPAASFAPRKSLAKPRAPLPIVVLAWLFISSAANILLLPFLPFPLPAIFFGRVIPGAAGSALLVLVCALFVIAGIGLLKLKSWGYFLSIAMQSLFLLSSLATWLNPNYESQMASYLSRFNDFLRLPASLYSPGGYLHHLRWAMGFAILFPAAILVLLLHFRKPFLENAAARS